MVARGGRGGNASNWTSARGNVTVSLEHPEITKDSAGMAAKWALVGGMQERELLGQQPRWPEFQNKAAQSVCPHRDSEKLEGDGERRETVQQLATMARHLEWPVLSEMVEPKLHVVRNGLPAESVDAGFAPRARTVRIVVMKKGKRKQGPNVLCVDGGNYIDDMLPLSASADFVSFGIMVTSRWAGVSLAGDDTRFKQWSVWELRVAYLIAFPHGPPSSIVAVSQIKALPIPIFELGTVGVAIAQAAKLSGASRIIEVNINSKIFRARVIMELSQGGVNYSFKCIGSVALMQVAFQSTHNVCESSEFLM
ncbi:hypothetical protein SELMODRAFT_412430 [Selaginella moellendorffii]|uniref:Uncharacterized protein n=1 Tax=Selaginella moellendorffii TaxID=88036 RepID=D8RLG9_SELML|nr:hypothetical protein SELMODRAFT_412430 [Selaginella moellendorffii]